MLRYLQRRLALRLVFIVAAGLGMLLLGGRAFALPPTFPPWERTSPVFVPDGQTGWRPVHHMPGASAARGPTGGFIYSDSFTRNGTYAAMSYRISEPWITEDDYVGVTLEWERSVCDRSVHSGNRCDADPASEPTPSLQMHISGYMCYDVVMRTQRELLYSGDYVYGIGNQYTGTSNNMLWTSTNGDAWRTGGGTYAVNEFSGHGPRCNGTTETVIGITLRFQVIRDNVVIQGSYLEWRADGFQMDWDDEGGLEQCVLWFGDFWGPDWPLRHDGKTPAEVGCDRWRRDTDWDTDFSVVCKDPPEIEYYAVLGLSVAPTPPSIGAWIGHYAECLFVPRGGFDTERIHASLEDTAAGQLRTLFTDAQAALPTGQACGVLIEGGTGSMDVRIDTCEISNLTDWSTARTLLGVAALIAAFWSAGMMIINAQFGISLDEDKKDSK